MRVERTDELTNFYDKNNNLIGYIDETSHVYAINKKGYAEKLEAITTTSQAKERLEKWRVTNGLG